MRKRSHPRQPLIIISVAFVKVFCFFFQKAQCALSAALFIKAAERDVEIVGVRWFALGVQKKADCNNSNEWYADEQPFIHVLLFRNRG